MTLFLLCTSAVANSIIFANNILFNKNVDLIILLSEIKREYYSINHMSIVFYPTILECITNADLTISIKNDYVEHRTLEKAKQLSLFYNKLFYEINCSVGSCHNDFDASDEKPCILHIFSSPSSQQFEGEALMYSVFNEYNIKIKNANRNSGLCQWALNAQNYEWLSDFSGIAVKENERYDLLYVPLFLEYEILNINKYYNYIMTIKPDYIIVQTDCSYDNYLELQNVTKYLCNRELDLWIKSRYYNYIDKNILSYQNDTIVFPPANSITNLELRNVISFEMLSKLAFPGDIRKYK